MKLLKIIFLIFFSPIILAEDIKDFQIEGISIGDSLNNYFTIEEINKNTMSQYYAHINNPKFKAIEFYKHKSFNFYESVQFNIMVKDEDFTIYNITAANFYRNKIDECLNQLDIIKNDLSSMFKFAEYGELKKRPHFYDKTGDSYTLGFYFLFSNGDSVVVECYDWSKKITNELGYVDKLSVSLDTITFYNWLHSIKDD